jgi:hypothetical protein
MGLLTCFELLYRSLLSLRSDHQVPMGITKTITITIEYQPANNEDDGNVQLHLFRSSTNFP